MDAMKKPEDIFSPFNLSYVARSYMGKSRTWLYQRLNHSPVGRAGTPGMLNEEDLIKLKAAFRDLSKRADKIADGLEEFNKKRL